MEENREPLSAIAIEKKLQLLRNKHFSEDTIALVKSDYEYRLTEEEISLYLNKSYDIEQIKPVRNPEREKPKWEDTITNRMLHWSYTPEQKEEVKKALAAGVPKATILTYFYPEVTVEKMSAYRNKH